MKLIIGISEDNYKLIQDGNYCGILSHEIYNAIKNGIPFPKRPGRLFDERDIVNGNYEIIGNKIYELEPIIEADKEGE